MSLFSAGDDKTDIFCNNHVPAHAAMAAYSFWSVDNHVDLTGHSDVGPIGRSDVDLTGRSDSHCAGLFYK